MVSAHQVDPASTYRWYGNTYGINQHLTFYNYAPTSPSYVWRKINTIKKASEVYLAGDSYGNGANTIKNDASNWWARAAYRHQGRANYLFCELHASSKNTDERTIPPWRDK